MKTRYILVLTSVLSQPGNAWAHAFGQRYDLPLPLSLYLWSAGAAVALSFVVAAVFLKTPRGKRHGWQRDISDTLFAGIVTARPVRRSLQALALFLFALVIATGLFGTSSPAANFAPVFVWIIWWVGMAYLNALLGNVWDLVNPWRITFRVVRPLLPIHGVPPLVYPERAGVWPAVVLFLLFAYLEFISGVAEQPYTLAWCIVVYTMITFTGMLLFGENVWLRNGEAFTVVFGLMARFGLFRAERNDGLVLRLRPPGYGLLSEHPASLSLMAFAILMLTTVTFDGLVETPFWHDTAGRLHTAGMSPGFIETTALVLFYGLFIAVYLLFSYLVSRLSGSGESAVTTARTYVLTLVPIAIAYHLAHYLSYLLLAGQLIIPVASDPFGYGWNLFDTAGYRIDISVIGAKDIWYLSIGAIVTGHIIAVCLAHATALRRIAQPVHAIVGQLPMLVLMVGYTMISLWILSQPIVAD